MVPVWNFINHFRMIFLKRCYINVLLHYIAFPVPAMQGSNLLHVDHWLFRHSLRHWHSHRALATYSGRDWLRDSFKINEYLGGWCRMYQTLKHLRRCPFFAHQGFWNEKSCRSTLPLESASGTIMLKNFANATSQWI